MLDTAFRLGWGLVRALPEPVARWGFRLGADVAYRRGGRGVAQLRANLRRVLGPSVSPAELAATVQAGLQSYARYWREAFRLPTWSRQQIVDRMVLENHELLDDLYGQGRGVVVALPHSANWDHAGAYVCAQGMRLSTVAERLKPEPLYRQFVAYRESLGMEIFPATGAVAPLELLTERLRAGRLVVLLADRDLSTRGMPVRFFGSQIRVPPGPALLALRTGAPLLVASLWYEPDQLRVRVHGPIEMPATGDQRSRITWICQQITDQFAVDIAAHPADWHMLQRLWLDDRVGDWHADGLANRNSVPVFL